MEKVSLNIIGDIGELVKGISHISGLLNLKQCADGIPVDIKKGEALYARYDGKRGEICYVTKASFFRMLGLFVQNLANKEVFDVREQIYIETCGIQLDMSRNGVMKVESIKKYLQYIALMGLNRLGLYMEDVFEVRGRPYFGYMRGRYTYEELKAIDDYAYELGIEAYPCIEVLGHMEQYLKYWEARSVQDTETELLAENEDTYQFIELLIQTVIKPFRTNYIGLAMDETHSLGLGHYLKKFGYKKKEDILLAHLKRVSEIAQKNNLEPFMYADMFFRFASKTGAYYDKDIVFTQEIIDQVPENIILDLWYYRGENPDNLVESLFENQLQLSKKMSYSGGIWSFNGFLCDHKFSLDNARICLPMCKKYGVNNVTAIAWGDNGCECDYFYTLLSAQAYGEHMYHKNVSDEQIKERFEFITGANYDIMLRMSDFHSDITRVQSPTVLYYRYVGKRLMWQDIMMGLMDCYLSEIPMSAYYKKLADDIAAYKDSGDKWEDYYRFAYLLCDMLSLKCEIAENLRDAYLKGDKEYLRMLTREKLPKLLQEVEVLKELHRKMWHSTYKPFGFECIDVRYGGLKSRIETAIWRVEEYLDGIIERLEELEAERLPFAVNPSAKYERMFTASSIR